MKFVLTTMCVITLAGNTAHALELSLPLACEVGRTCIVQNYVDRDPGPRSQDYHCGAATNNGHKGTDFRVQPAQLSGKAAVVVAAAAGTVKAGRNNQAERFARSAADRAATKGVECGNGVVITHDDGWETQYCHLKRGSVRVRPGDRVKAGTPLGRVGKSGSTVFYHVHLTVRHDGKVVDPYVGLSQTDACTEGRQLPGTTLWSPDVRKALGYRDTLIFRTGFTEGGVTGVDMEKDEIVRPTATSPALTFYAHVLHLKKGDRIALEMKGPKGFAVKNVSKPVDRAKAQFVSFAGKRRTAAEWPAGNYAGVVTVVRAGRKFRRAATVMRMGE